MKYGSEIFKALSDETRLRIFLLLSKGELCVCELVNILKMEQSRISHSLRILKEAGLIKKRREGTWIIYSIDQIIKNNQIIKGLIYEIKLSDTDFKNYDKYKKEGIRKTCKLK